LGPAVILEQVGRLQLFVIDRIVLPHQRQRRLMVKILPLTAHLLVRLRQQRHGFAPALAPFLAPTHPALGGLERALGLAIPSRVKDAHAIRQGSERFNPQVDPGLLSRWRQGLYRYIRTGEANVPAIRLSTDRDGFGRTFQGTRPAHGDPSDFGQDQEPIVECGPIAKLLVGEASVAIHPLKAGIPWRLACRHAGKEALERSVEPCEHILQHLRMNVAILWTHFFNARQLSALHRFGDAHPALLPRLAALRKSGIVEFAAAARDKRQRPLLLGSGFEFIFVGLADKPFHTTLFCLIVTTLARRRAMHPPLESRAFLAPFL
jgi:hypothetical protein